MKHRSKDSEDCIEPPFHGEMNRKNKVHKSALYDSYVLLSFIDNLHGAVNYSKEVSDLNLRTGSVRFMNESFRL